MTEQRLRLGERLLAQGVIGTDQLRIALREQQGDAQLLGQILVRLGFVAERVLRDQLGEATGYAVVDLQQVVPESNAVARVPRSLAERHRLLPLSYCQRESRLDVAMANPANLVALDQLRNHLGAEVRIQPLLAAESEIATAMGAFYGCELSCEGILHELESGTDAAPAVREPNADYQQPIVRFADALLGDAVRQEVSDIHLEPEDGFARIRYRIDGVLQTVHTLHADHWNPLAIRFKVLAGLDIAETRAPQDGRITRTIGGRAIDFRVSVIATLHGESIVLRILDQRHGLRPMADLGLDPVDLDRLHALIARPEGLLLVTGPTGSGKTSTLYSLLAEIRDESRSIVTLEDPVEYPLPLIRQTPVNPAVGLDFGHGVRSLLRQDPDVMLIGEIRDAETATMALRAAMTGHLVFATLHAASAPTAIGRLAEIGLSPGRLAGNLIGVIGQRLVRRLCPACRQYAAPEPLEVQWLAAAGETMQTVPRETGCDACQGVGFTGRTMLFECLPMSPELDECLAAGGNPGTFRAQAVAAGYRDLVADALRRVRAGETTLAEVARGVDLTRGRPVMGYTP